MPILDANTLAVVSALAAFFMAVTMGGIYLAGNREAAVSLWALSGLMFSVGHFMGNAALAHSGWVAPSLAIALGNASIMAGFGLLLTGIQWHLGTKVWVAPVIGLTAFVLLVGLFWSEMQNDSVVRITLLTIIYLLISLVAAGLLWREGEVELKPYRRAVAVVILAYALWLAFRSAYIVSNSGLVDSLGTMSIMVPVFLSSMLFYMALNVSLALMLFRRKEVRLRFLARHDPLTGLLNRYSLDEIAARELARAKRGEHDVSVVLLDLDNFKQVNDRFGHAAGDQVLVQAARRIEQVVREGDVAFRVGGEEFLVLLSGAKRARAEQVAERLRRELVERPFECLDESMTVSTSVGVVTFNPARDDWKGLLRHVDQALYRAKDRGRNRVEVADRSRSPDGQAAQGLSEGT